MYVYFQENGKHEKKHKEHKKKEKKEKKEKKDKKKDKHGDRERDSKEKVFHYQG